MEKLNAIVIEGKVYEAVEPLYDCCGCELNTPGDNYCIYCDLCTSWGCIFRYSQPLTDKLNRE